MIQSTLSPPLTLEEFLATPEIEASPAWELTDGTAQQKPMPTLFHSRIQRNLVNYINARTKIYEAIQELRCIVPPNSPVPDISVIATERLGEEDGPFNGAPDWLIEVRSPDQSTLKLQSKILHCLDNGTQLAWLIDCDRGSVWVWDTDGLPMVYEDDDKLPDLGLALELTVNDLSAMARQR
ncbi:MAG: Uma2 family endonuclease [Cyanophyceae cyanobacterium]